MALLNKHILITGGSSGIGLSLAIELKKRGAQITVLDLVENNSATFDNFIKCNVSQAINVYHSLKDLDPVDILINNAAVTQDHLLVGFSESGLISHPIDEWHEVFDVNLNGLFYVTREVVLKMVQNRVKGLIINVSSIASLGNSGQSAYSASKAAVESLTLTWAKELSNFKIRVAGIAPGFVDSGITSKMPIDLQKKWIKQTPLKRLATEEEIIKGFIFIIENAFFNGRILQVDGGLRL